MEKQNESIMPHSYLRQTQGPLLPGPLGGWRGWQDVDGRF
jgi:hypothetical protein